MDNKISEMLAGTLAVFGAFITKRIFKNQDALSDRVSRLEQLIPDLATKEDLAPIQRNVEMIVSHLITKVK
jgi:hypothetical protein|tara:strand:+ start:430 stop:642 length:213 start_codon:yes stop_codon:yes gene_type:complete